jgi:hypothetical protein
MIRTLVISMLMATLVTVAPSYAQERTLPPVDEGAGDSSWAAFKKRLMTAIEKKDKQFLLSILDPKVRSQDERARGVATFRKQWELDAADSPVWRELANALALGTAYVKRGDKAPRELCAPYVLGHWPGDFAPATHAVAVGRDTLVQAEPSSTSASLGKLSYDIVPVTDWEVDDKADPKQKWVRIRYKQRDGYVPEELLRSPIEHAACFVKGPNGWRMIALAPAGGE